MTASNPNSNLAPNLAQMRIESIKAGLLCAGAIALAAIAACLISLAGHLPLPRTPLEWLIKGAVALSSGFFFGVTYRYIVRQEVNLHLGSGAVGAFALVRSLAAIEASWNGHWPWLNWLLVTGESFLWFAVARYSLDWAMRKGFIAPLE